VASVGTKLSSTNTDKVTTLHIDAVTDKTLDAVSRLRRSLFIAADLLWIWAAALLIFGLGLAMNQRAAKSSYFLSGHIGVIALYSVLVALFCHAQSLYSGYPLASFRKEASAVFQSAVAASALLAGTLYLLRVQTVSILMLAETAVCSAAAMSGWRYLRRKLLVSAEADGVTCHNVLIVGTGRLARAVRNHLTSRRELGRVVIGLLRTDREPGSDGVIGAIPELRAICRKHFVDEILVCTQDRAVVQQVVNEARHCGVGVRQVPDFLYGHEGRTTFDYLGDLPTVPVIHKRVRAAELKLKRLLDFTIALAGLIGASPALLLIALIVKLDSRGPIFYRSERVGKKGRIFTCYKFRTMVGNADKLKRDLQHLNERDGILFKIKDDPRVTRSGRILRKYSLDELAQLWNVLKGDMSLVGPRPPLASEVQQYESDYLRRLEVAPGITGLWQVEARMSPSFHHYIRLDLQYVENWSFLLDLQILGKTIGVVFAGTGA
jgi:exopolysaccharide biosynthesis polyprenyl glycosylphosphotransferase